MEGAIGNESESFQSKANQFNLRLPLGMRDKVRDLAKANERSMNSEIIYLIKKGMDLANDKTNPA